MITDGIITYGGRNENISTWRFSDDLVNELAIAALLTILSYQVAEMIINLAVGFKSRGAARLRDLHIILLIRKFSPMSVLRSIYTWNCRRRRNITQYEEDEELAEATTEKATISYWAYLKLICLIIAIPLVNVGTVVLSFERDTTLTFAQADFRGLAMGLDENKTIDNWFPLSRTPKSICEGTALETNAAEFAIAEFYACTIDLSDASSSSPVGANNTLRVDVALSETDKIIVSVILGQERVNYLKRTMVLTKNPVNSTSEERILFFVKHNVSEEQAWRLASHGIELASELCDSVGDDINPLRRVIPERKEVVLAQETTCERDPGRDEKEDKQRLREVALNLTSLLSFVNHDKLEVRNGNETEKDKVLNEKLFSGTGLLLLKRRRGFASIPVLAISALVALVLRVLSELITRNDLERGIGLIVRDGLGLPCCDSMLCSTDVVVRYNRRGNVLHSIERQIRSVPNERD